MTLKMVGVLRNPLISTGFYLAMGWLIVYPDQPWLVSRTIEAKKSD